MFDAMLHPFAWAISYVWVWIHDLLVLLGMSSGSGIAWVLSIVLLTILVRIAIIPLFLKQIRSSRAMQAIQPEMRKIQEKYKGKKDQVSRQKMMEETQALQRKHKVSPFASCLPMLVQMPVLFGMYRAIIAVSSISAGTYTYRGEATDHLGPLTASVSEEIVNSTVFGVRSPTRCASLSASPALSPSSLPRSSSWSPCSSSPCACPSRATCPTWATTRWPSRSAR